jgi:hypothetical protein
MRGAASGDPVGSHFVLTHHAVGQRPLLSTDVQPPQVYVQMFQRLLTICCACKLLQRGTNPPCLSDVCLEVTEVISSYV